MTAATRLDPQTHGWIAAPATRRVIDALEAVKPGGVRFVGGCVRNSVMGRAVDDVDLATQLAPDAVIGALDASGVKVAPTGLAHGTVTAVVEGRAFEITSLRADVETDGRRAVVAFTEDWDLDWRRRDFTMNALYAASDGTLFDPSGSGLDDAAAGYVRFIGDPETRIREDYLRILRFFRFFAWYGAPPADGDGVEACARLKDGMAKLSVERIGKELLKLLGAPDPRHAVSLMQERSVMTALSPDLIDGPRAARLVSLEQAGDAEIDAVRRLAALTGSMDRARNVGAHLKLSKALCDRLQAAWTAAPDGAPSAQASRAAAYRHGVTAFDDGLLLAWAGTDGGAPDPWRAARAAAASAPGQFPLSGTDALDAGAPKGPAVGAVLRAVEDWWVAAGFPDDPSALKARLRAIVQEQNRDRISNR